jgi:hypothetical protein
MNERVHKEIMRQMICTKIQTWLGRAPMHHERAVNKGNVPKGNSGKQKIQIPPKHHKIHNVKRG